jgi:micrococcal nuclease
MDFCLAHRLCRHFARLSAGLGSRLGVACLVLGFVAHALADCGIPSGMGRVAAVDERLDVALQDGRLVRLGGLDAPSPDRGSPAAAKDAREFLSTLLIGKEVELDLLARSGDRWGRVVGDLSVPDSADGRRVSAAAALLAAGYARVRPEFETRGCSSARLALEDAARRTGLGIWRDPEFAVIPASDLSAIQNRDGQFVVIEGAVRRVGFGHSRLYLDLAPRGGPTVVVPRKLERALARADRPVGELAGQTIRARGALDDRFGPRIEVSEPPMIEIVRHPDASGEKNPRP